jgi:peptide methionine sulfoxide reductase MsrB
MSFITRFFRREELSVPSITLSEQEWKSRLTEQQYYVLRRGGTERAFTGSYWSTEDGDDSVYVCSGCYLPLFSASAKYDSRTGWPSFFRPMHVPPNMFQYPEISKMSFQELSSVAKNQQVLRKTGLSAVVVRREPMIQGGRREVLCRRCNGHLGHVFSDGPLPTLQRYCINSVCLSKESIQPNSNK